MVGTNIEVAKNTQRNGYNTPYYCPKMRYKAMYEKYLEEYAFIPDSRSVDSLDIFPPDIHTFMPASMKVPTTSTNFFQVRLIWSLLTDELVLCKMLERGTIRFHRVFPALDLLIYKCFQLIIKIIQPFWRNTF